MSRKTVVIIAGGFLLMVALFFLLHHQMTPRIAYVRSQDLIYGYEGMKEAQIGFNKEKTQWVANVDTLEANFKKAVATYQKEYSNLKANARKERERGLQNQEMQLDQYKRAIDDKIRSRDQEVTEEVLNQINQYAIQYAEAEGYDFVLGTTVSGNLLYANDSKDITEELLDHINKKYAGDE